jgi:CheY-like chemotaxis protein
LFDAFGRNKKDLCSNGQLRFVLYVLYDGSPMPISMKQAALLASTKVLLVDDEFYMRKVVRTLLMGIGVRTIYEAADGPAGLEQIRRLAPDVVILDWQMPGLDGPGFVRTVRSPATFCHPNVPIIMLTGHSERKRVLTAVELGVNAFLLKPVSSQALQERLLAVLASPGSGAPSGDQPGQEPGKMMSDIHADTDRATTTLVMLD